MTWEELYDRAEADHARFKNQIVAARNVGVSDGNTYLDQWTLRKPVNVTVYADYDANEHDDDGGLLDVRYDTEEVAVPGSPDYHVWWIPGPTYYLDGRVDYPEWWPKG